MQHLVLHKKGDFIVKDKDFGARLRSLRKRLGLTQTVVAQKVGISYKALQDHEGGGRPNRNNMKKYLDFYGCDEAWLLFGKGGPFQGGNDKELHIKEPGAPYNALKCEGEKKDGILGEYAPIAPGPNEIFKLSDAITMAVKVLESNTSYSVALYTNIQHFYRAILAENKIAQLEIQNEKLEKRMFNLEKKLQEINTSNICKDESCERRAA